MHEEIREFIAANHGLMLETLRELCLIPAPSHHEEARAEYCRAWLERNGCAGAYIDGAKNVIFPLGCGESREITVLAAHTDTVFPDTEPMPYHDDGERIHCPGCADDTAAVVILMLTAKFFAQKGIVPKKGILFVCNSCEEGLGNLKGVRALFEAYAGRIGCFVSYDSELNCAHDVCVGSHRYEVTAKTVGGHSFNDFGAENAIAALAGIVTEIYKIAVPHRGESHTTYNVGTICGGTSVNTIAQSATMLCEYRSDDFACMEQMRESFARIFAAPREGVELTVTKVGDRPCGTVDGAKIEALKARITPLIEEVIGERVTYKSASTDCNIPLSLGVPALCIGVCRYHGMHTREEWLDKASLLPGLEVSLRVAQELTK